jgi:RNA polymerase sigma factor (sigma-70 family)
MAKTIDWDLGRYRPLLRMRAELIDLQPRIRVRLDCAALVDEALRSADQQRNELRGLTEAELIVRLQRILEQRAIDMICKERAKKRNVQQESSVNIVVEKSSMYMRDVLPNIDPSPGEHLNREERLVRVAWALNQLEEGQRQAVLARLLMGVPIADIAKLMGQTEKSVTNLLRRARKRLRDLLGEKSGDRMEGNHHARTR